MPRSRKVAKRSNVRKLKVKSHKSKKHLRVKRSKTQTKPKLAIKKHALRKNRRSRTHKRRQRGGSVNPVEFSAYPQAADLSAPNGEIVDTSAMTPEQVAEANAHMQKGGFVRALMPQAVLDLGDMARNGVVRSYNMYMGETSPASLYSSATVQPALEKVPDYDFAPNDVASKVASADVGAAAYSPVNVN